METIWDALSTLIREMNSLDELEQPIKHYIYMPLIYFPKKEKQFSVSTALLCLSHLLKNRDDLIEIRPSTWIFIQTNIHQTAHIS